MSRWGLIGTLSRRQFFPIQKGKQLVTHEKPRQQLSKDSVREMDFVSLGMMNHQVAFPDVDVAA
jgi:hypothetical protein